MKIIFSAGLALILGILAPGAPGAFVIDRIEAVVNGKVITKSEVDRAAEMESVRLDAKGKARTPEEARKEALDAMISRMLVLEEARKLSMVTVSEEDVQKAYDSLVGGFSSKEEFEAALRKEEITPEDLRQNLGDQLLAARYIDRRIKFFVRVTLDDQKKYYEENRSKLGGKEFREVQEDIYNLLVERETARKLEEYLNDLKKKAKIEVYN